MSRTDQENPIMGENPFTGKYRIVALNTIIDLLEQLNSDLMSPEPQTTESVSNQLTFQQLLIIVKDWAKELKIKEDWKFHEQLNEIRKNPQVWLDMWEFLNNFTLGEDFQGSKEDKEKILNLVQETINSHRTVLDAARIPYK